MHQVSKRTYLATIMVAVAALCYVAFMRDVEPLKSDSLSAAQKDEPNPKSPAEQPDDAESGVRKNADEYTKAFNAKDAKAAATCFTPKGEYIDTDGEIHLGREAIEKELAAFMKEHPKATIEIRIDSVRPLGHNSRGPGQSDRVGSRRTRTCPGAL
jgi:hypothetical protein